MDIDIDICPSKRPIILNKIRKERSAYMNENLPEWAKNELGCTLVATFGTEKGKSVIQTACRGYRSEDYPDGIDVDTALYISSLIPVERGFLWEISDVVYGNEEKNRKPIKTFVREVNKFPGLLDIIMELENLISRRGSHASGVIMFDGNPFERCAFMRTSSGDIITQWDLHDVEYRGMTKYDFLVTEVCDKLVTTINLLQKDGEIESDLSLREVYNKYFHPDALPLNDSKIWNALRDGTTLGTFQFDSLEGRKAAKKIAPTSIIEMSDANGLLRLMGEEGEERPIDRYCRMKKDINIWYREMDKWGLSQKEQKTLEPYFLSSYGTPPSQEQLMRMLMDENIAGFQLGEANAARKIVAKKQMKKIPELHKKILEKARSERLGAYVWKHGVGPQLGYSFSLIHSLAYSFIGIQTLFIATNWNPIYWNTACLIVDSGSLEDNSREELVDIYAEEASDFAEGIVYEDLPDKSAKIRKTASTDYSKVATALGKIMGEGIKVSLTDINKSDFSFKPDVKNNQILFGLKGLLNVSDDFIKDIIVNRPYKSPLDFVNKVKPKKQGMISLIKSGAFNNMISDTKLCLAWYIWETCDKKKLVNMRNMLSLIKNDVIDPNMYPREYKIFEFNRYLKAICKIDKDTYSTNERVINFLNSIGQEELISDNKTISAKKWDKIYQKEMDVFRKWMKENQEEIVNKLNETIFKKDWIKYAGDKPNLSKWEMEVMCFYYHEHELKNVNKPKYGIMDFNKLPEEPVIDYTFKKGDKEIKIFVLNKIAGTCIAKNKTKGIVSILTESGVVNVKFPREYFNIFDRQLSERQPDGTKKVIEKSWFGRGNKIIVTGIRQGDDFISKKYSKTPGHRLYRILDILPEGDLEIQSERADVNAEV